MLSFIIDGGPGAILILIFGPILIIFSALFAKSPAPHRLRFVKGVSVAMMWLMVGSFAIGVRKTLDAAARMSEEQPAIFGPIIAKGISESLTIVIMGTAFLTLSWFISSIGIRRMES